MFRLSKRAVITPPGHLSNYPLCPFHNCFPTALNQFAIVNLAFRTSCRVRCTMHRICFMCENSRIRSPLTFEHVQNSEETLGDSNCCIGSDEHSHNVVLTRNSVARISKVARWFAPLYACVVRPWDCCKTCRILSCNVVLPLYVTCPLV